MQDGEIWTFSVRAFDSPLPERTINVNYGGFAEGMKHIYLNECAENGIFHVN